MTIRELGLHNNKPIVETASIEVNGLLFEMMRDPGGKLVLAIFDPATNSVRMATKYIESPAYAYKPLREDEITNHVRFARSASPLESEVALLREVEAFLGKCIDVEGRHRSLLAAFVLSTWFVDQLPIAPYVALVGLPGSGKSTALHALYLLCRCGLMTSDISSAAFYRACDRLMPTLCFDEASTADHQRSLFHLLRSGTSRHNLAFREGRSYSGYGAKVVVWTETPEDAALNSRCIMIPMRETDGTDLPRTTDPEIIDAADQLQAKLMFFRLSAYAKLKLSDIPPAEGLRSRDRDLYQALALPISKHPETCARLLECFEHEQNLDREPLPPNQLAVLETVFRHLHLQPDERAYRLRALTPDVNAALAIAGERFRMNERAIGSALNGLGLPRRKRNSTGYVVLIDRAERKRVHALLEGYGLEPPSSFLPEEFPVDACEFCRADGPLDDPAVTKSEPLDPPIGPRANGGEHGQRNGERRDLPGSNGGTPGPIQPEAPLDQHIMGSRSGLDEGADEHNEHSEQENGKDTQAKSPSPENQGDAGRAAGKPQDPETREMSTVSIELG